MTARLRSIGSSVTFTIIVQVRTLVGTIIDHLLYLNNYPSLDRLIDLSLAYSTRFEIKIGLA